MTSDESDPPRLQRLPDEALIDPADLVVGRSAIAGEGLFTARPFRAREVLMILTGEVIDAAECARREAAGNVYIYWIDDDRYLDGAPTRLARFVNHACAATAIPEGRDDRSLYLVALRDLAAGEEVAIDYDFPEIYRRCRAVNPACLGEACAVARAQGGF
ncbi:MAG: SET domain-containing protein [Myxococcales bacterium]|nr:SET domain-containing protein [Myxococcales bacterium]